MKKIDEQIEWYDENSTCLYDDVIKIDLKKINELYEVCNGDFDEVYVDEMISAFCNIIEKQRQRIMDLETENGVYGYNMNTNQQNFVTAYTPGQKDFEDDKQIQEAFTAYMFNKGKSSYTVNDYCSRLRKLWKEFYEEYNKGELPAELEVTEEIIKADAPLLNVFNHVDEMNCYIGMKIDTTEKNRNWLNVRAAYNNFADFAAESRQ